jgi:hypothetical protein
MKSLFHARCPFYLEIKNWLYLYSYLNTFLTHRWYTLCWGDNMTMYYLGIFLWSHLIAGVIALIIDYLFYKEIIPEFIEELNLENNINIKLTMPIYSIVLILGGWISLFSILKGIFEYYSESDDE